MNHKWILGMSVFVLASALGACSGTSEISISDPWARPALEGGNGAAYLIIDNPTGEDEVLLSAYTDAAGVVELHDVVMKEAEMDDDDGTEDSGEMAGGNMAMQMVKQENVPIPARESVTFKPGSFHVMLIGLTSDLAEGDTIRLTLVFQNAGEITLDVPVEQR